METIQQDPITPEARFSAKLEVFSCHPSNGGGGGDPNMLGYVEDKDSNVLSLAEMVNGNTKILNTNFSNIVKETRNEPSVLITTKYPLASIRFGKASFKLYQTYGAFLLKMYFHLINASPLVNFIAFFLFMNVYLSSEKFILKIFDRPN